MEVMVPQTETGPVGQWYVGTSIFKHTERKLRQCHQAIAQTSLLHSIAR